MYDCKSLVAFRRVLLTLVAFGSRLVHSVHGRRSVRQYAPPRDPPPSCRSAAPGEQRGDASGAGRTASTHGCGATRPGSSSTTPFIIVRRARLDGGAGSVPEPTWSLGLAWPARRRRCADSNLKGCPTQPAVARKWGWMSTPAKYAHARLPALTRPTTLPIRQTMGLPRRDQAVSVQNQNDSAEYSRTRARA